MKKQIVLITAALLLAGCGSAGKPNTSAEETVNNVEAAKTELIDTVSGDIQLVDSWLDKDDSQVTMAIIESEKGVYEINITIPKSDSDSDLYTMHGSYDPASGMLSYSDGKHSSFNSANDLKDDTVYSGALMKEGKDTLRWQDDTAKENRVFNRNPEPTIPYMKVAEGPYVLNSTYTPSVTEEEKTMFQEALKEQIGIGYTPVQILAEQTVNGKNYAFLAYAEYTLNKFVESYAVAVINRSSSGEITGLNFTPLDVNDLKTKETSDAASLLGGWKLAVQNPAASTEAADAAFKKAMESYDGELSNVSVAVLLGTLTENDTVTYRFLCRADSGKEGTAGLYVIDVKEQSGSAGVASESALDLLYYIG